MLIWQRLNLQLGRGNVAKLIAEQFKQDSKVLEARQQILTALQSYQRQLSHRPAAPSLQKKYKSDLLACEESRGGKLYYPYLGSGAGVGPLVELEDGSVKYDFITGIGVHFWGHQNPMFVEAGLNAAFENTVMQGNLQQNHVSSDCMEKLLSLANNSGAKMAHCVLSSSGAMANENALKLIFQKRFPAQRVLCFEHCFSGRTIAMAQLTDKALYRDGLPRALQVDYIPFWNEKKGEDSIRESLNVLEQHLKRYPRQHAAMCFELIQGEGGYYPGNETFFKAIIQKLKEQGIAVWIDEIQTFGRTSRVFAFQHFHLDEEVDVITVGKMLQTCATLYQKEYKPRPGLISQTYTSSSSALHATSLLLDDLKNSDYFGENGRIFQIHQKFVDFFQDLEKKYPKSIKGPYGYGAMIAVQIGGGTMEESKEFVQTLFKNGLIAFIAGSDPVRVRFLPPIPVLNDEHLKGAFKIFEETIDELYSVSK